MKATILIALVSIGPASMYAQKIDSLKNKYNHEASIDIVAFYSPILSKKLFGGSVDFKYYPFKKIATGLSFSMTEKKVNETYSFSIQQPVLDYYEFGWINQYDIIESNKIIIALNLNNGIVCSRLADNAEKEKYWTKYGYSYRAKEVATNYFYLLQPGVNVSIKLISNKHSPDFYLTTKAKYRFVLGDSKYGSASDFSNCYFAIGLSVIGFMYEEVTK